MLDVSRSAALEVEQKYCKYTFSIPMRYAIAEGWLLLDIG